jgi:hypothetical protein
MIVESLLVVVGVVCFFLSAIGRGSPLNFAPVGLFFCGLAWLAASSGVLH